MTKDELIAWAKGKGYQEDRWGHFKKTIKGKDGESRTRRLKLSRIAVRLEVKLDSEWLRIKSGYYSKLSITADGKLQGMKL